MAPMMSPLPEGAMMGTPPPSVQKRPEMPLPMLAVALPGHEPSWPTCRCQLVWLRGQNRPDEHAEVGTLLPAAVKAMSMAKPIDVILAPSMRMKERRCVCASTIAIDIAAPCSSANCSAACSATRAPL
jgi:hypothetical protein